MSVLSREEYFSRLNERMSGDTSDSGIQFLEDMTDTYNSLEQSATGDGVNWEQRYRELDENWKKRYAHRFFSGNNNYIPASEHIEDKEPEETTISDLFTKKE